jgi:hypothetical protein
LYTGWKIVNTDPPKNLKKLVIKGSEFEFRWEQEFSLLHVVQTGSGVHPTSYPMGTGGSFPGVKRQGREADHSSPTSAKVKKMWIYISTPRYVFMA